MSEPFIAEITPVGFNFAPRGFAFCDGQLLPISQNTALFALIGTTYGGDGRSTTALPNLQGRAPMHPGRGPGLTSRRLGQRTGENWVTLMESQIPSHNHTFYVANDANQITPVNNSVGNRPLYAATQTHAAQMSPEALSDTGGSQSHINIQPLLVMNFVIALQGLFPARS